MTMLSCSWCHVLNTVKLDKPTWCVRCGHRADLPRIECNCSACQAALAQWVRTRPGMTGAS